uniref:Uncharacterized protein LOC104244260 n=1 Tax=Nicotiana sylvestris TaxID=4096 RepID=A0A1U7YFD2_NICSY|nr:PREDICTED: uncharacterized protein LOC104244260 [Nicotiana sylvestris]
MESINEWRENGYKVDNKVGIFGVGSNGNGREDDEKGRRLSECRGQRRRTPSKGPDVELPEGYTPPKFEMFDGIGDLKVHLRTYCDKLVGVGKDERIRMKLLMRSLSGDAISWYISQNPKKWVNWVSMASDFMDQFRFNTENTLDVFYIQNIKKKPMETFHEYATRWRSEAAKVRRTLEEE